MKPTPDEIETAIATMIGAGPCGEGEHTGDASVELWWVTAYDPGGGNRGIGTDVTLSGALAASWVFSHDEIANNFCRVPLSLRDFNGVPRHVPDDWSFEIDDMPSHGRA